MKKKDRIVALESDPNAIILNGKTYRLIKERGKIMDGHLHGDRLIFEPVDERQFEKDLDFIVERIQSMVDTKEVLKETLKKMSVDELRRIKKLLEENKPVKKTRGCYGLTIGDDSRGCYIQIA